MKIRRYVLLFVFLSFTLVFERQCITIFMFPHIVSDFPDNTNTAQRDFSVGQFGYWFSSFLVDPLIGVLVDKLATPYYVVLCISVGKVICGIIYSISTNITITIIVVCLSGALKNLAPIIYREIDRLVKRKDEGNYVSDYES